MFGFKILTHVKKWFPRVENNVSYFEFEMKFVIFYLRWTIMFCANYVF